MLDGYLSSHLVDSLLSIFTVHTFRSVDCRCYTISMNEVALSLHFSLFACYRVIGFSSFVLLFSNDSRNVSGPLVSPCLNCPRAAPNAGRHDIDRARLGKVYGIPIYSHEDSSSHNGIS
jgi:hypothetical protein